MVGTIRAVYRLFLFVILSMYYALSRRLGNCLFGQRPEASLRTIYNWSRAVRRSMGLSIDVRGEQPAGGVLVVSNHISYIDIIVIGSVIPSVFLAKKEVKDWPFIGKGAEAVQCVFVDRGSPENRKKSLEGIYRNIQQGVSTVVFPEGTTGDGRKVLPFKQGIFDLAAEKGMPVLPVSLSYEDERDAWYGDDTFFRHFMQTFRKRKVALSMSIGMELEGGDSAVLKKLAWNWICHTFQQQRKEKPEKTVLQKVS